MAQMRDSRFGRQAVINCKAKEGKNGGTFGLGFVEIGGRLYKVSVTENRKDGGHSWVKIAETRRGGGGGYGGRDSYGGGYGRRY